jgi:hypothetical protein
MGQREVARHSFRRSNDEEKKNQRVAPRGYARTRALRGAARRVVPRATRDRSVHAEAARHVVAGEDATRRDARVRAAFPPRRAAPALGEEKRMISRAPRSCPLREPRARTPSRCS